MPEDGGAQIKTPAQWINLPPVVGKIGFDFTFFLIYARQAAKICLTRCCSERRNGVPGHSDGIVR